VSSRTWTFRADALEVRALAEGEKPVIRGYAAVYNSFSENLGKFRERIAPGAFADALTGGADVRALWNHDTSKPLGRTKAGTLQLSEDALGLHVEIDPPDTSWGRDAVEAIKRGDVDGMSFAFQVREDEWSKDSQGGRVRTLLKVGLIEVSPVTFPAYPATQVGVRCVAAGDMPDVPDDGLEPVISADDAVVRGHQERERQLRLVNLSLSSK
jgi:HK97 family phage prohead protease